MLDTSAIYECALLKDGFNEIKLLRDQWNYSGLNSAFLNRVELCEIFGSDFSEYEFVMREAQHKIKHAIQRTVFDLMRAYSKEFIPVKISWNDLRSFSTETTDCSGKSFMNNKGRLFAFILDEILFIFRDSGTTNYLPAETIVSLKKEYQFSDYRYILLVEGDAFSEVLNHNNDENDPSRGTHLYSLQLFFNQIFSPEEYAKFKQYYFKFIQAVKDYFGLAIVKTLRPNSLYTFKKTVRQHLIEFDYSGNAIQFCKGHRISESQHKILRQQFIEEEFYQALTGNCEFAKCFMTAEWLYDSFRKAAGSIDLTAISMGYFKALEQFLYELISLHTFEKDGVHRQISLKGDPSKVVVRDRSIPYNEKRLTLGALCIFFGEQQDLFRAELDVDTKDCFRDVLSFPNDYRNGYFHKDNIHDWETVERDRNLTYTVFYLLLGAYKYREGEKEAIGISAKTAMDDYQKLCHYVNKLLLTHDLLSGPVLYINDSNYDLNNGSYCTPVPDKNIKYNEYGDPTYSGLYVCRSNAGNIIHYDRDHFPDLIQEGTLLIGRDAHCQLTGPQKVIFKNGVFMGKE